MNAARTSSTALKRRQHQLTFMVNGSGSQARLMPAVSSLRLARALPRRGPFSEFGPRDPFGRGGAAGGLTAPI